ncbi:extracellular solute-binding protein [Roseovarius sp. M141]|uniref:extracellular solute-binding protein n=1 Tax=Roseovarius sp. M141 TaxID=2583806 RepID=UPI0034E95C64
MDFAAKHKKNIGAYWNNATEATGVFTDAGCTIGQTWDTTGIRLHIDVDPKWRYAVPKEGGLGWMDTVGIPSGAENVDGAYEFINFLLSPEIGAMHANNTGYNTAAAGATKYLSEANREAFDFAYPEGAIDNLWWWPVFTPWFSEVRQEYVEKADQRIIPHARAGADRSLPVPFPFSERTFFHMRGKDIILEKASVTFGAFTAVHPLDLKIEVEASSFRSSAPRAVARRRCFGCSRAFCSKAPVM